MSLATLPPKIGAQIWRLLLTRPCPVDICYESTRIAGENLQDSCHNIQAHYSDHHCDFLDCKQGYRYAANGPEVLGRDRWRCVGPMFTPNVLLICQTIYTEAVDIFYKENKFILDAVSVEGIPTSFNFARVRSLHIDTCRLRINRQSLEDYKRMIQKIRLHPETSLSFNINNRMYLHRRSPSREDRRLISQDLVEIIQHLGPVKSCALSLSEYPHAKRVAKVLVGNRDEPIFPQYNKLPAELRYHILSFTDLVQEYHLYCGQISCSDKCCGKCSESLFGCCCIKFSLRRLSMGPRHSALPGSYFSETCQCRYSPLELLKVSPEFQQEALRVLFTQSTFELDHNLFWILDFLYQIEPHLKLLRKIELSLEPEDFEKEEYGSNSILDWEKLVDYIEPRLSFPSLQLIIDVDFTCYTEGKYVNCETTRAFYRTFIPGLKRLKVKGLTNFWTRDFQNEDRLDEFEQEVLGERYIHRGAWQ